MGKVVEKMNYVFVSKFRTRMFGQICKIVKAY